MNLLTVTLNLLGNYPNHSNGTDVFRTSPQMDVIFVDFKKQWSEKWL